MGYQQFFELTDILAACGGNPGCVESFLYIDPFVSRNFRNMELCLPTGDLADDIDKFRSKFSHRIGSGEGLPKQSCSICGDTALAPIMFRW